MRGKEIIILIFCLLIGFGLRFYTFDQKSFWGDEIHTYNDSRDDLKGQLKFYREEPNYLHPPLFFILTHSFYPFTKPERDLRLLPLIFGTLSIPMIYFLARLFSPHVAFPCTVSLTFMTYHISLSQEGRSYSMLMFLGIVSLYFFMNHLKTLRKRYVIFAGFFFAILFYTSYSSIPFIILSQILWFYRTSKENKKAWFSSFLILNSIILLFCLPWIFFVVLNYKGQPLMTPLEVEGTGSFISIVYRILHDWVPYTPLMIASVIPLFLFPFFSKSVKNALLLLAVLVLPIGGLYLLCKLLDITHFVTSRYFINFLPLFFITIYLSLNAVENKFERLKRFIRLVPFFLILFIASNLIILPLYYRSEKEDYRGLVTYLKGHLREGDNIFVTSEGHILGILHYFRVYPEDRHYFFPFQKDSEGRTEFRVPFIFNNKTFIIYHSKTCCSQYVLDKNRLWIVANRGSLKEIRKSVAFVWKGYFDGSFLNMTKFPEDASMYLFLLDPKSPGEKGMNVPTE